jgi:shikimate dehydrogenase
MRATTGLRLGLLGYPVSHSASPAMHNAALLALGIAGRYELCPTPPGMLSQTLQRLTAEGFTGLNVTLPHKVEALSLADEAEESALAAGAANVLYQRQGRWIAANTDGEGLYRSLLVAFSSLRGVKVMWLGAGGATLTAASFLVKAGARLVITARKQEQGQRVAAILGARFVLWERGEVERELLDCRLLIQATPATMSPEAARELLAWLPLSRLPKEAGVCDLVYRPKETLLLQEAKRLGHVTIDGSRMLLYQGGLAFSRFTQREAPLDVMAHALAVELV